MSETDKLRKMIAGTLGVNASDITEDFSLKVQKFKTSAGSVILGNMVKKVYGRKVDCRNVSTFGELLARINGDGAPEVSGKDTAVKEDIKPVYTADSENGNQNAEKKPVRRGRMDALRPVCGIDIQEIDVFPKTDDYWSESFYTDNFTKDEIAYCITAPEPRHSFAARWCLKEALHKCGDLYYDIPLKDIQAVRLKTGELRVEIRDDDGGFTRLPFACSISHADHYAVGMVMGYV